MGLLTQDSALQSGVDFMAIGKAGATRRYPASSVETYEFGTSMTDGDTIAYGGGVIKDTDGGVRLPASGDTVAELVGFAAFQNTGIIEDAGYKKGGIFHNVAVCELGEIILPVKTGDTLDVGDTLYLYYGAGSTDADYNTITNVSTDAIDISTKVRVAKPSSGGLVYVKLVKYSN